VKKTFRKISDEAVIEIPVVLPFCEVIHLQIIAKVP
jgi:hypothetical protein